MCETIEPEEKQIAYHFQEIMKILGLDLEDSSLKNTPNRVAKMYFRELFKGLNPDQKPELSLFENQGKDAELVLEKNITIYSTCEHHFLPIIGKAHVAYIPGQHIIGLSKINRLVDFICRKPQLQERMTIEICHEMMNLLQIKDVACLIEADHLCVRSRGIRDTSSQTITWKLFGKFQEGPLRSDFLSAVGLK